MKKIGKALFTLLMIILCIVGIIYIKVTGKDDSDEGNFDYY